MNKKSIEKEENEEFEKEAELKKEEFVEEFVSKKPVSEKIQFRIIRIDYNGLYVADEKGNGRDILVPKEYKIKDLKAGDIIYVSKSEL